MKITIHLNHIDDLEPLCRLTSALEDDGHKVTWEHDGQLYEVLDIKRKEPGDAAAILGSVGAR